YENQNRGGDGERDAPDHSAAARNLGELAPPREQRSPEPGEGNLLVELRVAHGNGRLVDQDRQKAARFLVEDQGFLALERQGTELALLVLEKNPEEGAQAGVVEKRAELLLGLGTVGGDLAVL